MEKTFIYLDYAAATPVDPKVTAAMLPYFSDFFYNPSAPYSPALDVRREYEDAKGRIARSIGGRGDDLVITAGATESIALAFGSVTGHVVVSNIEHHAVMGAAQSASSVTTVEANSKGFVSAESIAAVITPETQLVSIALANNELGTIQPLRDIAEVVRRERLRRLDLSDHTPIYLHSDASQGVGQLDVNVARLGVDMLTINASKVYGPKQVGALWAAPMVQVQPLVRGGGQERGLRSGTENVPGVIGFALAMEIAAKRRKSEVDRLMNLRNAMQKSLLEAFPEAVISGHERNRLAGHLHISFPNLDAERVLFSLESKGVLVATGSACAANKGTRSHVLTAIGLAPEVADGSLRITLGKMLDEEAARVATSLIIETVRAEYSRMSK